MPKPHESRLRPRHRFRRRGAQRAAASGDHDRADGKIADANVAAEAFFEVSMPLLRGTCCAIWCRSAGRCWRWSSRCATAASAVNEYKVDLVDAAQSGRPAGRPACRAAAGASRPCRGDAPGAHHRRQDGPPADASRRGALGDRAGRDAGARDQESAVGHSRRRATARTVGRRRRPHADAR